MPRPPVVRPSTAALLIPVLALLAGVGCFPIGNNNGPEQPQAKPGKPEENPRVVRTPDNGPRVDARRAAQELAGVRVRVTEVWVSRGIDDGAVRWGNVPTDVWMKVTL